MIQYELFDGNRYLYSVSPSENPFTAFHAERKRFPRLRMVSVEQGVRDNVLMSEALSFDDEDFQDE